MGRLHIRRELDYCAKRVLTSNQQMRRQTRFPLAWSRGKGGSTGGRDQWGPLLPWERDPAQLLPAVPAPSGDFPRGSPITTECICRLVPKSPRLFSFWFSCNATVIVTDRFVRTHFQNLVPSNQMASVDSLLPMHCPGAHPGVDHSAVVVEGHSRMLEGVAEVMMSR